MIILLRTLFEANSSIKVIEYIKQQIIDLYKQLTTCDMITNNVFFNIIMSQPIYVDIDETMKIRGVITILIERKIIHNGGYVCHIEDVVVDFKSRGKQIGSALMKYAIQHANEQKCYKIILDCHPNMEGFYQTFGFEANNFKMSLYL